MIDETPTTPAPVSGVPPLPAAAVTLPPAAPAPTGAPVPIPTQELTYGELLKPENKEFLRRMQREAPVTLARLRSAYMGAIALAAFALSGCQGLGHVPTTLEGSCMGKDGVISAKLTHALDGAGNSAFGNCKCSVPPKPLPLPGK